MKQIFIFLFVLTFTSPACAQEKTEITGTTTFYFIRHAEKDRSDQNNKDPHLTKEGLERAVNWRKVFDQIAFDAVYSTDYNRTRETAEPTAIANKMELTIYNPRNLDGKAFLEENKGKTVLVVGHSNTTPTFVNSVLGEEKYKQIDDNNNANLYMVIVSPSGEMTDVLLVID